MNSIVPIFSICRWRLFKICILRLRHHQSKLVFKITGFCNNHLIGMASTLSEIPLQPTAQRSCQPCPAPPLRWSPCPSNLPKDIESNQEGRLWVWRPGFNIRGRFFLSFPLSNITHCAHLGHPDIEQRSRRHCEQHWLILPHLKSDLAG